MHNIGIFGYNRIKKLENKQNGSTIINEVGLSHRYKLQNEIK